MSFDYSNVNISLQQFQDISSGKYNAGEVRLADESNLKKMNNHVHRTAKIEDLCGKVHPKQLSAVYFSLSQSAVGQTVKNGFLAQGIVTNEHMPLTYALAKDDATGAITVTYSEPAGFSVHFHWTATITLDGTVTTTPMVIEA